MTVRVSFMGFLARSKMITAAEYVRTLDKFKALASKAIARTAAAISEWVTERQSDG